MIAPVIANLGALEALSFKPNPSEVKSVHLYTVHHHTLLAHCNIDLDHLDIKYDTHFALFLQHHLFSHPKGFQWGSGQDSVGYMTCENNVLKLCLLQEKNLPLLKH